MSDSPQTTNTQDSGSEESRQKPKKLDRKAYEKELKRLQAELVEMQQWVVSTGARLVIIMEGRDAAGKGSAIKRITQYLNPRTCRIEALPAPNSREQGQWYFQRYVEKLPTKGEIVIFDRSWYNRAGVERVMGFATSEEYRRFLHQAPIFERLLVEDGIMLRKYWFSVSDEEQLRRFESRRDDPLRRWKLSPMDMQSITRWEDYSKAKDEMFVHTDIPTAPWYTVESEDKKRSRINVINHLLSSIPYEHIEQDIPEMPERPARRDYERPPRSDFRYVPDVASNLEKDKVKAKKKAKKKGKKNKDKKK
ncbi:polyphosphate kinase 2 [Corynebacterium sp. MC-04]|uniref:ADP/GDP-polyphosphate phosphotransferase n=2 Tax=Corynebacterium TaxID=1716 RepID=C4LHJ9_CORK4|nr:MULTISPECIES: polyphosphate kinase 2 [Corynebacterium]ACR17304.1 polyphosphate kinase [Corynebacterium kroppenstedtii DSM 44385]KXB50305.1 polyphosphate kinase 2 [Corynebacterium kroppenstedtii]MBY0788963.1 polyphosphate kinase 2 [Corynebacterium parakroppenstedtii]MBY0793026.1 polyphosphate kinase 2 [Corynebacterium parakroppenstedtii]MBY0795671.1 polyphosphate kinase 2 [Corynebacterium parakroppenstedtii]